MKENGPCQKPDTAEYCIIDISPISDSFDESAYVRCWPKIHLIWD